MIKIVHLRTCAPLVSTLLALGGCAYLPPYQFKPDEKAATVQMIGYGKISICKDGMGFIPPLVESGKFLSDTSIYKVPVGERIQFNAFMQFQGYRVITTCNVKLSFSPEADRNYYAYGSIKNNGCELEMVREDKTKDTGVSIEPSVGGTICGR